MKSKHIKALAGIRGIAALWVMLHHLVNQYPINEALPDWILLISYKGWLGVDLFFILSGFVISYVHQTDFKDGISLHSLKRFMILRFIRIYPVHFIATISLIPIYWVASHYFQYQSPADAFSFTKFFYSLSLTNGLGIPESAGWNVPSWSVSSEAFAYLLFPCLTFLFFARTMPIAVCLLSITVIFIVTTAIGWNFSNGERYISSWSANILRITSEFSVGCLLFNIYKIKNKFPLYQITSLAFIAVAVMTVLEISSKLDILFLIAFSIMILGLSEDKGVIASHLGNKVWTYLGEISYSIYICHGVVFMVLNALFSKFLLIDNTWHSAIAIILYLLTTWLVSHVMYSQLEVKARLYFKGKLLKGN